MPSHPAQFHIQRGTRRVQARVDGTIGLSCFNYPFGDGLSCTGPDEDATEHHFTGKEHDTESGLDMFGARYYGSGPGRFMTPDWEARPAAVPYAVFGDPQSLNLYGYVRNDPVTRVDADGHCSADPKVEDTVCDPDGPAQTDKKDAEKAQNQQKPLTWWQKVSASLSAAWASAVKTYETTKTNPDTGKTYSGRTSGTKTPEQNVAARDANHHMNEQGYGPAQLDKSSTNAAAIRGREQQLIELNGGAQSEGGASGASRVGQFFGPRVKKLTPNEISVKSPQWTAVFCVNFQFVVQQLHRRGVQRMANSGNGEYELVAADALLGTAKIVRTLETREHALRAGEVARLLGVTRQHIYKMAAEGTMPSFRLGTAVRFDPKLLAEWLRRKMPEAVAVMQRQRVAV